MYTKENRVKYKALLKKLKESEANYKELVEHSRSIILRMDTGGRFTFVNEYAKNFFGFNDDEIIGKTALETIVPEIESTGRRLDIMLQNFYTDPDGHALNVNENIKKNGERVWIEWHNKAVFNSKGERSGHIAFGIDITDRVSTSESLKKSEENFRLLFEKMGEAFALHEIILDETGKPCDYRFLTANPSFEKHTGIKVEKIIGKRVNEVFPSTEKYWIEEYGAVALSGTNKEFENYSSALNRYFRVSAFCPQPGQFATLFVDITDSRLSEIELKKSKEKLEFALESGHIGIWERNLRTGKVLMDKRMESIMGIDPGTFNGDYLVFEELINEEDLPHFRKGIDRLIETGSLFETIFRTRTGNGNYKYISAKTLVNKDDNGLPVNLMGVCFDVTTVKEGAEKAILKLNEELLRSNKELEQFAYVASHDLQEPLRMVSSFTQLLSLRYKNKLDQNANEFIQFAVEGATRMQILINDLLDYSRIETKGKKFSAVNMQDVLGHVVRNLNFNIREKNGRITSDELPVVFADASQMIQLLQNLIGNSLKFSKTNPLVHISVKEETDHFLFFVKDNGIGIDSQYFNRIFQIFQRLHARDEYGGTGIGLAICKRIIERHGGKIWVDSEPGRGSVFYFSVLKR